jgi:hypothetical protein
MEGVKCLASKFETYGRHFIKFTKDLQVEFWRKSCGMRDRCGD